MSFKRDGKKSHEWQKWVAAHRGELCQAGVPDSVLRTNLEWLRFLEENGCLYDVGWFPEMLSKKQAVALHAFVLREYGNEQYRSFLRTLEVMLTGSKKR